MKVKTIQNQNLQQLWFHFLSLNLKVEREKIYKHKTVVIISSCITSTKLNTLIPILMKKSAFIYIYKSKMGLMVYTLLQQLLTYCLLFIQQRIMEHALHPYCNSC